MFVSWLCLVFTMLSCSLFAVVILVVKHLKGLAALDRSQNMDSVENQIILYFRPTHHLCLITFASRRS